MKKLLFLFCVLLMSCDQSEEKEEKPKFPSNLVIKGSTEYSLCTNIVTFYDTEKKVTCYTVLGCDGRGAIWCMKNDEVASQK